MNETTWYRLFAKRLDWRTMRVNLLLLGFIVLIPIRLAAPPLTVTANSITVYEQSQSTAPTTTPPTNTASSSGSSSPFLAILVLAVPLAYLAWQSRGKKAPEITAACCLPVIDEKKRPFQIYDDEQAPGETKE